MLPATHPQKRDRPRGLWKARVTAPRFSARRIREREPSPPPNSHFESDADDNDDEAASSSSTASKKKARLSTSDDTPSEEEEIYYWDYSRRCSPYHDRVSSWASHTRVMDTTTTAGRGVQPEKETCDFEDWEDLKELFAKAAEQYEDSEASEALPTLRGVIHECHRFLLFYQDPSVLFANPAKNLHSPRQSVPPSQSSSTEMLSDSTPETKDRKCTCVELPTAFHAILGTALFLFGNLIAQEPKLALEGEPDNPVAYWLAALDVFETGENLPSRTSGIGCEPPEDWRMAIVWGRTLVCIADETLTRAIKARQQQSSGPVPVPSSSHEGPFGLVSPTAQFSADEPDWPPDSPFAAIAARRPPITRRMSLSTASPNDLMVLAMDQFSRGIFHMPHPQHSQNYQPPAVAAGVIAGAPPVQESFSRAKELFTIASEVLLLSEKLEIPSERKYWASWADSVFNQMKMEADMDSWRAPINRARGRCWLIVGSAGVDDIEAALERGEVSILESEDAQEAREGLATAISFFERAKSSATVSALSDPESQEMQTLLAEALLTLANLTTDERKQEELYARAQLEGGEDFGFMDQDDDGDDDAIMEETT
ncbi:hypothetical protein Hypma_000319 [Hypsizygus marmoreus]|uniref:Uncharacterized protein n=1 Tax=Hypsizygus marmoreus TaxID=39966 RepID=A0A369JI15_HYPMA|nr:hypothetical protein Hypma_000319 [Hypsizygus marmoreus]